MRVKEELCQREASPTRMVVVSGLGLILKEFLRKFVTHDIYKYMP